MKNVSDRSFKENQTQTLCSIYIFFLNVAVYKIIWKRQCTDDSIRCTEDAVCIQSN